VSHRTTIGLGLALAVALFFAWRDVQRARERPVLSPAEQVKPLLKFEPAQLEEIVVQRGGREVRFARSGEAWSGGTDPGQASGFVEALLGLAEIMVLDVDSGELADLGLAPPRASIRLRAKDRPLPELFVGSRNPAATGLYLQVGKDGRVVLTGALLEWEIDKLFREEATPVP